MRRLVALVVSVQALVACGGSVRDPGDRAPSGGGSSAGDGAPSGSGSSTGGSGAAGGAPGPTTVPIGEAPGDDYPAVPENSAAFFWRYGLGNWFVTTSDGQLHDADLDEVAGTKIWKGAGKPGTTVDLWAQLNHPVGTAIDLSAYSGITFDARLTGTSSSVSIAFNANGDYGMAALVSPDQQKQVSSDWRSYEVPFSKSGGEPAVISSIDFIVGDSTEPLELAIRNLSLTCNGPCP
jgi:hypothetical protein